MIFAALIPLLLLFVLVLFLFVLWCFGLWFLNSQLRFKGFTGKQRVQRCSLVVLFTGVYFLLFGWVIALEVAILTSQYPRHGSFEEFGGFAPIVAAVVLLSLATVVRRTSIVVIWGLVLTAMVVGLIVTTIG